MGCPKGDVIERIGSARGRLEYILENRGADRFQMSRREINDIIRRAIKDLESASKKLKQVE
jgi:hypothetical protein